MTENYTSNPETLLNIYLQQNVKIFINDKLYKRGKIVLYSQTPFFYLVKFHSSKKNKIELLKIPYPFKTEYHEEDKILYFDYRVTTFTAGNLELTTKIKNLGKNSKSRYWDSIMEIIRDE